MPDTWKGRPLPERRPVNITIHYRLYDAHTGDVLSINSTNAFDGIVEDVVRTQREHPNSKIVGRQFDGPAYR